MSKRSKTQNLEIESTCKPTFAPDVHLKSRRKQLFDDDSIKLEHSFGYQCSEGINLCPLDKKKIIIAAGCYMMIFDVNDSSQSFFQTVLGLGISRIITHPNRKYFAVAEKAKKVRVYIYSYPEMKLYKTLDDHSTRETCNLVQFQPKGDLLITISGYPENKLTLWQWKNEKEMLSSTASTWKVCDVSFSNVNPNVFSTCGEHQIKFWKIRNTEAGFSFEVTQTKSLDDNEGQTVQQSIHLPNEVFLAGAKDGYLLFWKGIFTEMCLNEKMGRKEEEPCHQAGISEILLMGDFLITLGMDGWVYLWSYKMVARRLRMMGEEEAKYLEIEPLDQIQVNEAAQLIHGVPALTEKLEKIWYIQDIKGSIWQIDISAKRENNPPIKILKGPGQQITAMDTCKEYPLVAVCSKTGLITISDCTTKTEVCYMYSKTGATCLLWPGKEFDGKGASLLVGFEDGTLRWMVLVGDNEESQQLCLKSIHKPHSAAMACMSLATTQTLLATYGDDNTLFFFSVIGKYKLIPLGFYNMGAHMVKWMTWIKKPKESPKEQKVVDDQLEKTEDTNANERISDRDEMISKVIEKKPSIVYETFDLTKFVEEGTAFPPAHEVKQKGSMATKDSDDSVISVEDGKLSDSSRTSSSCSSPYEEEKQSKSSKAASAKKKRLPTKRAKKRQSAPQRQPYKKTKQPEETVIPPPTTSKDESEIKSKKIEGEEEEEAAVDIILIESLLICCRGSYLLEVDAPEQKYFEFLKERRTFHIPYDDFQIYNVGVFEPYHDLGDRVYDSEDEEHPNRSELAKKHFRDLKYADKKTARRRKRREQPYGKPLSPPEVLGWLQSENVGRLWLSLGEYDYGYLFECAFVREEDRNPVYLKPVRAIELLTSERMAVTSLCMSSCGEFIFLGQQDGKLSVCRLEQKFDISTGYDFVKYPLHDSMTGYIICTKITPDNKFVVTAGLDGNVFLTSFNVTIKRDIDGMGRPHSGMIKEATDISDPCALSIEQALAKSIRLEIVDKVTSTLSELNVELPILKDRYNSLKSKHEALNEAYLQLPDVSNFRLKLDISSIGGHPKCIAAFHKMTQYLTEQIGLKFKGAIAQWASYLSKLRDAFEDSIEEPKLVKNFISDEIIQSYVECRLPHNKQTTSYKADVFEYEKYIPKKREFVPNTQLLEKLDAMLNKTRAEVVHYPADMPLTENFVQYNNRKLEKLGHITQRKRFEEANPRPLFDEEDDYFTKKIKEIEDNYYKLKSDPDMKNHLPKEMKLNPQQKKEQILSYLKKMRNLWHPYNLHVAKLERMLQAIEQWDLGLGEKEKSHQEEITAKKTIEAVKDITDVIEAMVYSVSQYFDLQTDVTLTEIDSIAIANSNCEDHFPSDASSMENVPQIADDLEDIFNTEFCDDECYYTPAVPRYHPVAYSASSSEDDEEVDAPYPYSKSSDTCVNNTDREQSAESLNNYKMEGITVHVATRKTRPLPNRILTKDYCFEYEITSNKEAESGSTDLHGTDNEHKCQLSNSGDEKESMLILDWEQSWEILKAEIEAKCLRKNLFDFNSTSKSKSPARSQIQVCSSTPEKDESYENSELKGHKYFFGIEQTIKEEEEYENMRQAAKQSENRMMIWKYFNNFHHVMVILRYKMDCEKKYQDLVFNIRCRELNIIEHDYPEIQSCIEKIREAEGDIKFECVKLELLEHVLVHTRKQVEYLKLQTQELHQNFMSSLGENHKHTSFFSKFFQIKSKIKAKESKENMGKKKTAPDEEEEEEEEEDEKDDGNQMDEDEYARALKINATLYRNAKLVRQEIIKTEIELKIQKKRLERCENKKQYLIKRVKKLRGTIADIIPEIRRIQVIMKSKLDEQKLHVLVYKRGIECDSVIPRNKDNFILQCKNVLAQLSMASNIVEAALVDIEKAVTGSILRELGRVARTLLFQYAAQRTKTKAAKHAEQLNANVDDSVLVPATMAETKDFTAVVKPMDKDIEIEINDFECGKPEAEGKIDIKEIIDTGIRNYENYSEVIEGDYFLFPEYFMHPVSLKNQNDINTYQVVKKCISHIIDNLEVTLNDLPIISVNDVMSEIVHAVSTLTEVKAIAKTPAISTTETKPKSPFEESEPVNPGGSILYDITVLAKMEKEDPGQYKYTDLFHEFVEVSEVIKDKRESIYSFVEEEDAHQFDFDDLVKHHVIVSKGCIEDMEKMRQYLHVAFKLDGRKYKEDSMYLLKLKTLNYFLEKSSVRRLRFQVKDSMASKLGRELDLEMLLDTLDNPHYHVTRHELEKELEPLRRNVQIKQKAITIQKMKKEKIVYANHLLWIEYGQLQHELDCRNKINSKKRKELLKKSRNKKF